MLTYSLRLLQKHESSVLSEVLTLISSDAEEGDNIGGAVEEHASTSHVAWWTPFVYIIGFQLFVLLAGLAWRRWTRRQDKDMKRI